MSDTKFTPGPWRYDRTNGSPTTGEHMIAGAKPGYLAEVRDCGSGDVRANAHLIAAAPDLYAALEYYADTFCEGFCNDLPQAGTYIPEMDTDCSGCKARAALAKARGEA